MLTKDRVGGALAVVGAIIGLVLVFSGAGNAQNSGDDGNGAPVDPPSISQVVPAPDGQVQAPPGQSQPAAPPAQAPADNDGDG